jgi:hypothetical protein
MMQGQVWTCPGVALCRLRGMFIFCPENKISLVDIEDDGIRPIRSESDQTTDNQPCGHVVFASTFVRAFMLAPRIINRWIKNPNNRI